MRLRNRVFVIFSLNCALWSAATLFLFKFCTSVLRLPEDMSPESCIAQHSTVLLCFRQFQSRYIFSKVKNLPY